LSLFPSLFLIPFCKTPFPFLTVNPI
jgi:hypothetical protein